MTGFRELGLDSWLVDALGALAIRQATEVQQACIPAILSGRDVIGGAKTGSGKTAAFALPILQRLSEDPFGVFAVVLTPTRELAGQIAEQFVVLGKGVNLRVSLVIGGVDMMTQALELSRRPHVVVATPGRLADIISSSSDAVHMQHARFLVLDEADRLLTDPFAPDLAVIMDALPRSRQTLLFTATMTASILALRQQRRPGTECEPFVHVCASDEGTVAALAQSYVFVPAHVREAYLVHVLAPYAARKAKADADESASTETKSAVIARDRSVIIFVGQCRAAETLRVMLQELGFRVAALHSKMPQPERQRSLGRFRAEAVRILVATDVASRGLDIPHVDLVVNMHVPRDADDYIHRVGRTARAGRGGRAITIVSERDVDLVHNIEARIGKQLDLLPTSEQKVLAAMGEVLAAKRAASLHLLDTDFGARDRQRLSRD
ncbi:putative RNA helicase [Coemansia thaxteri]|nr:putative RNA helicase [Coemansia thaxteri]